MSTKFPCFNRARYQGSRRKNQASAASGGGRPARLENGQQMPANRRLAARRHDLGAREVGYIERIDRLFTKGHDMGGPDVQIELRKGGSEVVEKARTVEPGNLEHGVAIRKRIVDHDLRLDGERSGARVGATLGGDDFADFDLAAQRLFDRTGHAPAASQLVLVAVEGARNEDRVER